MWSGALLLINVLGAVSTLRVRYQGGVHEPRTVSDFNR